MSAHSDERAWHADRAHENPSHGAKARADRTQEDGAYWDAVYTGRGERRVSWYQAEPRLSAELIGAAAEDLKSGKDSAIVDAGGGASVLAARLTDAGYTDVTVVDLSAAALAAARRGTDAGADTGAGADAGAGRITWITADLLTWQPPRAYQIWHDRAVFHFLTSPADRAAYLATLRAALCGGGAIILATFAADGPEQCSGLPVARYDAAGLADELAAAYGGAVTVTGDRRESHRTPAGAVQPFTWITARLR